jgi:hypothetical protein
LEQAAVAARQNDAGPDDRPAPAPV